jgi:hypothetical protein
MNDARTSSIVEAAVAQMARALLPLFKTAFLDDLRRIEARLDELERKQTSSTSHSSGPRRHSEATER